MALVVFILGTAVGSFLNAYIWRLRHGGSVWRGRSYCPKCRKPLRWYELIPLLSFAAQLSRCRGCKGKIDWQYPLVEVATAAVFTLAFLLIKQTELEPLWREDFTIAVSWYLLSVLLVLCVYDLRYGLVPDEVVLPAMVIALLFSVIMNPDASIVVKDPALLSAGFLASLGMTALGMIIGAGFFAAQYYLSRGRWVGAGDIRLGALMGAVLADWSLVVATLALSYIAGGMVSVVLLAMGKKRCGQTVPLGTFLTLGTAITMLYGQDMVSWYMQFV